MRVVGSQNGTRGVFHDTLFLKANLEKVLLITSKNQMNDSANKRAFLTSSCQQQNEQRSNRMRNSVDEARQ